MDRLSKEQRSECMARVKSRNTTPEKIVRSIVWGMGYRYRLNVRSLPGTPDIVFKSRRKAIFVHGCFWHLHSCKRYPKSRLKYWKTKLDQNRVRDRKNISKLRKKNWEVLVIWECELKNINRVETRIKLFMQK